MKETTLATNELYGPVKQGEGKSAGLDVMFLRLSGCNLACIWCDTPYSWNWLGTKFLHPKKYDPKLEVHKRTTQEIKQELYTKSGQVRGLVISGGEPLLQQDRLIPLLRELKVEGWWVEVETNGTIIPSPEFTYLVDQFNCSPKLSNAGEDNPREKRLNFEALVTINTSGKAIFKFVIQSDADLVEMQEIMKISNIGPQKIWLMPEGRTREEQLLRQEQVKKLAEEGVLAENGIRYLYNFSPRLHVLEFGDKRAV